MTKRKVAQPDLIDLLLADYQKPEDLIGENGILKQLTKAIVERALQAELALKGSEPLYASFMPAARRQADILIAKSASRPPSR